MRTYRWGILATGNIASSMAEALKLVPGANLHAVASRHQDTADAFAERWTVPFAYGSFEALLADPDVDIVYIATPNALHKTNILAALAAGKHVLCEKPMTTSAADTSLCAEAARSAGLFLMEAMWTAFFPAMTRAQDLIEDGAIGTPRHLTANFVSFRDPKSFPNLFDPGLGGGATLDLGVYPFAAALLLAGPIERAASCILEGSTGVDEMAGVSAVHASGVLSQLSFGFRVDMPIAVRVVGDLGSLEIPHDFHRPDRLHVIRDGETDEIELSPLGTGYAHEAIEVQRCLSCGALGSAIWPTDRSVEVASLLERVSHQ